MAARYPSIWRHQIGSAEPHKNRRSARELPLWVPAQTRQYVLVFFGAHLVLYSQDPEADRQFLAETFSLDSVDAGHGWLIFAMPPSEVAVHPADVAGAELYLMCDDLAAEIESLAACNVPQSSRHAGARSRRSSCPAGARSACTSRPIRLRSTAATNRACTRASPSFCGIPRPDW